MEQLDDLMDKLNSDKFCAVTVYDRDTSKPIFRNVTHEQIKMNMVQPKSFRESFCRWLQKTNPTGETQKRSKCL